MTALTAALAGANLIYGAGMTESGGSFGDFLSLDSTLRHMREQSQPRFLDRRVREDWEAAGSSGAYAAAKEAEERGRAR